MLRLAVPENLCSSPELPFDLILFGTGQRGHFGDVCFGRHAVSKHSLASFVQRSNRESSASSLTWSRKTEVWLDQPQGRGHWLALKAINDALETAAKIADQHTKSQMEFAI